ncbi:FtsK/SpoIIIE domain-containing protein [Nocardia paucivorans]|uniref:FtsK/SpoIIIE domain-containing protein n=1 Tax=Nocardia paucivorans TaxID=114259 RepID=UPI0005938D75|nr:FtsK/SpoIIIE domain-containing protein [Nocardia paucivorans]
MAGRNMMDAAFLVSVARNKGGLGLALGVGLAVGAVWLGLLFLGVMFGAAGVLATGGLAALGLSAELVRRDRRTQRRRALEAAERAAHEAERARFLPELHYALDRLESTWEAAKLWASLGLGRLPRELDPGAWPTFIDAEPTAIGARVRLTILDGHAAKAFAAKRDEIANALHVAAVRVIAADNQVLTVDLQVRNPLAEIHVSPLLDEATAEQIKAVAKANLTKQEQGRALAAIARTARITVAPDSISADMQIPLLMSEFGDWVTLNLATGAHGAVQGTSRSGKSIFLNNLLAYASLMRDVRVIIIDPNTAAVAPWWRTAYLVCNSNDAADATAVLRQVNEEMKARESEFWASRTDQISEFSPQMPVYLLVIDEVPEYAKDKDFQAELKRFGGQAAKFGGRVYPSGQKLEEGSLSTATRANLFDRFCFRVESRHDMGHLFENYPDLEARGLTAVDESMPQGTALVRTRSHPETCRARAAYLPTELCWAISDAIVAVRGQVRPLPGTAPELPSGQSDSNQSATDSSQATTRKKPVPEFQLPTTGGGSALPSIPQIDGQDGTVIPFDRTGRNDRSEVTPPPATTPPDEDTGTE